MIERDLLELNELHTPDEPTLNAFTTMEGEKRRRSR